MGGFANVAISFTIILVLAGCPADLQAVLRFAEQSDHTADTSCGPSGGTAPPEPGRELPPAEAGGYGGGHREADRAASLPARPLWRPEKHHQGE